MENVNLDTLVCSSSIENLNSIFLKNLWYSVPVNRQKIDNLKYLAIYVKSPVSAITHIGKIEKYRRIRNSNKLSRIKYKYKFFLTDIQEILPNIGLNELRKCPQGPRYTFSEKIFTRKVNEIF